MKTVSRLILLGLVLPICCFAAKADDYTRNQIRETYEAISRNIEESCRLCAQNPAPHVMVEILKKNDALCKNILAVASIPDDFKKALYTYADGARYAIAIIVLKTKNAQQYTEEETAFLKKWEQQRLQAVRIARKYGVTL